MGRSVIAAEKGSKEGEIVIFFHSYWVTRSNVRTKGYRGLEIKTFGLGSRIRDMALWDEPNVSVTIVFLTSNSLHNYVGQK